VTDSTARPHRIWIFAIAFVVFSFALPGCGSPPDNGGGGGGDRTSAGSGPGGRSQSLALTPEQEVKLGNEAFQEVLSHSNTVEGPALQQVRTIAEKIFHVALTNDPLQREINLHVKGWNWDNRKYAVVKKDQINAFCLPGGKVVVFTELLKMTQGKPDWLATVLSHEIAHALAHHSSERIARERMYRPAMNALGGLDELTSDDRAKLVSLLGAGSSALDFQPESQGDHVGIFQQIRELSYDRQQESEADHIGIFLMTFAGYDPREGVAFWEAMAERSGGGSKPEILSDHPSDAHRVAQMKVWAVRAHDALLAWNAGRIEPARGK
jgi:metalloendopeptidase OMA1, mitochondrial